MSPRVKPEGPIARNHPAPEKRRFPSPFQGEQKAFSACLNVHTAGANRNENLLEKRVSGS
jgi:hypothetical protein